MKRIQPYQYIVVMAGLFILAGLVLFSLQLFVPVEGNSMTVDPLIQSPGGDLYDLWFSEVELYDLSIDHNLTAIIFSSDNNAVNLLDRERKLKWDKLFATAPLQAKLSSCGNYAAIGTAGGRLHFTSTDQQFYWDDEGDPIDLLAISPNGSWVAAARSKPAQGSYYLELYSQSGELKWTLETGSIQNLFVSSEYLEQTNVYYTSEEQGQPQISAVGLDGRELWVRNNQSLVSVSRHGSRIAAVQGKRLIVYDALGYELWGTSLSIDAETVLFNPQNYNRVLVYGSREDVGDNNLFYFDLAEDLLWTKNVEDDSLVAFTADGRYIVTSSWRYYKEDYTQMKLLDHDGLEVNSWEVAMRVEHLLVSGHPTLVVIGGEDGYIDLVDLKPLISVDGNGGSSAPLYSPVTVGSLPDETKIILYFSDENSNLVPVTRSINATDNPIQAALDELIRGPARGSALYRTIPDKTASIMAEYDPNTGRLVLDLSPHFLTLNGETQSLKALQSIIRTASANLGVEEIYLTSEQETLEQFGQVVVEQPFPAHQWVKPLFVPAFSGNRYYLTIQEAETDDEGEADLQELLEQLLRAARTSLPLIPANLAVIDLIILNEQVSINLTRSFKEIFAESAGEKEKLQVALFFDALFLTVFKNSRSQRAEILVDGESWTPPDGYPALERFYRQPCYLNPEF
jgi:WD40 repeat protein